jgi:hypothetical protein
MMIPQEQASGGWSVAALCEALAVSPSGHDLKRTQGVMMSPNNTQPEINPSRRAVGDFSAFADIISFDFYPIWNDMADLITPHLSLISVDYRTAFPAYLDRNRLFSECISA